MLSLLSVCSTHCSRSTSTLSKDQDSLCGRRLLLDRLTLLQVLCRRTRVVLHLRGKVGVHAKDLGGRGISFKHGLVRLGSTGPAVLNAVQGSRKGPELNVISHEKLPRVPGSQKGSSVGPDQHPLVLLELDIGHEIDTGLATGSSLAGLDMYLLAAEDGKLL